MRNTVHTDTQVVSGAPTTAGYVRAYAPWLFVAFIAYIYLWYLQYKFTGHPGSVQLFTTLTDWLGFHGHEKFMRIGVGSMELTATTLLIIPRTQIFGAALSLCIMTGAIFFHTVSPLGIDPYGDGGVLFKQACATWISSLVIVVLRADTVAAMLATIEIYLPRPLRSVTAAARRLASGIDGLLPRRP
jgi:uncharacterized membrane protein YphA (DoxX/SURF4 family)